MSRSPSSPTPTARQAGQLATGPLPPAARWPSATRLLAGRTTQHRGELRSGGIECSVGAGLRGMIRNETLRLGSGGRPMAWECQPGDSWMSRTSQTMAGSQNEGFHAWTPMNGRSLYRLSIRHYSERYQLTQPRGLFVCLVLPAPWRRLAAGGLVLTSGWMSGCPPRCLRPARPHVDGRAGVGFAGLRPFTHPMTHPRHRGISMPARLRGSQCRK